jgi:hypothetical protein
MGSNSSWTSTSKRAARKSYGTKCSAISRPRRSLKPLIRAKPARHSSASSQSTAPKSPTLLNSTGNPVYPENRRPGPQLLSTGGCHRSGHSSRAGDSRTAGCPDVGRSLAFLTLARALYRWPPAGALAFQSPPHTSELYASSPKTKRAPRFLGAPFCSM